MDAPFVFRDLEWQVARVRRATELHDSREEDELGKGRALLDSALKDLDHAVAAWVETGRHATG